MKSRPLRPGAILLPLLLALYIAAGQYKAAFPFLPDITLLSLGLSFAVVVGTALLTGRIPRASGDATMIWLVITIFATLTALVNPAWPDWETKLARLVIINSWAFICGTFVSQSDKAVRVFLNVLLVLSVLICGAALMQARQLVGFSMLKLGFVDYLGVARLGSMGAIIAFWQAHTAKEFPKRLAWIAVMLALGTAAFASGGRGAPVAGALVLGLNLLFVTISSRRVQAKVQALILVVAALTAIAVGMEQGFFDVTMDRLTAMTQGEASVLGRLDRLNAGLELWEKAPLLGNGPNAFIVFYRAADLSDSPHNLIVELGAEFGLVPLFVITGVYLWGLLKLSKLVFHVSPGAGQNDSRFAISSLLLFWLIHVPLISLESGKYAAAFLGIAFGIIYQAIPKREEHSEHCQAQSTFVEGPSLRC